MQLPEQVKFIISELNKNGYEGYIVGGCVRDYLMAIPPHDYDITTSALPEEVKAIFPHTVDTGIEHGTVTVIIDKIGYELTTYRIDGEYKDNRHPEQVIFTDKLAGDLSRRDFTVNAIAYNDQRGYVDMFGGMEDIKKAIIKGVGEPSKRFQEDALRMMRAVRFMSQLKFTLEEKTEQAIVDHHELLRKISVERVRDEFVKMGIGSDSRQAFQVFLDTKLSEDVPDFEGKSELLSVYPKLKFSPTMEASFWSIIMILLKVPNNQISKIMRDWKNSNAMIDSVERIVDFFDILSDHAPTDYELFQMGKETLLNVIDVAHILGQPVESKALVDRYAALPIKKSSELTIDGRFLIKMGITPGPNLGKILEEIKKAVISGQLENDQVAIENYLN